MTQQQPPKEHPRRPRPAGVPRPAPRPADKRAVPIDHAPSGGVMKLTGGCVYALRAVVHLARHEGDGFVPADTIAAAAGLSDTYLRKSLNSLARAGVLRSERGPNGGHRLARPARSITLLEVVEAVDGPVRGRAPRFAGGGGARLDARLQRACDGAAEAVRLRLRKVSVADLAAEGE
jgi:Rrf2 family protein